MSKSRWYSRVLPALLIALSACAPALCGGPEPQRLTAEEYWYYQALSLIVGAETREGSITGTLQGREGLIQFVVSEAETRQESAKTAGHVKAVRSMLSLVIYGETEQKKQDGLTRLEALTGIKLATADEWLEWLRRNEGSLSYSESLGRLVIDLEKTK